jgi:hypothetical protein
MLWILFAACPAYCSTYFVDPNGNDSNTGDINHPYKTITKGVSMAAAGDTIYLRGGTHTYTTPISISKNGTADAKYRMFAYPGDSNRPILDFSGMGDDDSNRGITLSGSYWYIKGIDIYKAGDNGMIIKGNYNRVEFCRFYENRDSGLQLSNGAAYNEVINCDSFHNYDAPNAGANADGFSPKLTVGTGNYFYGCRSWQNSDDGYDCYLNSSNDVNTTFENCWAFKNGWYWLNGTTTSSMNGNGFKMGSSGYKHNIILKNCLTFSNKAKGFDQNHNIGSMTLYNCTAFSNGGNDYSIYEALASGKTAEVNNCVSFTGSVSLAYATQTTDSWQSPFFDVNSADFVNIDPCHPCSAYGTRKADGSLPDINFMHLAAGSKLINGGTYVGLPYHGTHPDLGYFEYGGCTTPFDSDLNSDCEVDFFDYARLAEAWGSNPPEVDLNNDGYLNLMDIAQFATDWLTCNRDPQSECWQ